MLRWEARCYNTVTVITSALAERLGFHPGKYNLLPLGGDLYFDGTRKYDSLKLLYVGTLDSRRLNDTVIGVHFFLQRYPNLRDQISYTIIGDGYWHRAADLAAVVKESELEDVITVMGYIPPNNLAHFFASHNVGVCYVPITPFYDVQPSTKTYEYLLSGMPVIATRIQDNIRIINETNGVLCDDTPVSFAEALDEIHNKLASYRQEIISTGMRAYTWDQITKEHLLPIISGLIEG
jgi:glycosyltransferase involved in cell wall biosynthesis